MALGLSIMSIDSSGVVSYQSSVDASQSNNFGLLSSCYVFVKRTKFDDHNKIRVFCVCSLGPARIRWHRVCVCVCLSVCLSVCL